MFDALKNKAEQFKKVDISAILGVLLNDSLIKAQVVDLNQKQMYEKGVQSDGSSMGEYAPITISYYKPLARREGRDGRSDHVTGKDTGYTYRSMNVEAVPDGIVITADDVNDFFETRAEKGLGLTEFSLNEIRPEINEKILEKIHAVIQ